MIFPASFRKTWLRLHGARNPASLSEVQDLPDLVDIVTGCASKHVRDLAEPLAQVGTTIPLFALTEVGKELVVERAKEIETPVLINTIPLPVLPEQKQSS